MSARSQDYEERYGEGPAELDDKLTTCLCCDDDLPPHKLIEEEFSHMGVTALLRICHSCAFSFSDIKSVIK
jgi:hypothetical protein